MPPHSHLSAPKAWISVPCYCSIAYARPVWIEVEVVLAQRSSSPLDARLWGGSRAQSQSAGVQELPDGWTRYIKPEHLFSVLLSGDGGQRINIRVKKQLKKRAIPGSVWLTFSDWRGPSERPRLPPSEENLLHSGQSAFRAGSERRGKGLSLALLISICQTGKFSALWS